MRVRRSLQRFGIAGRLATADLLAERLLAVCTILALAGVLAPLIILGGLRAGVVQGLREVLLEDPRVREVTTAANRSFDAALLVRLAQRPDVAFLVPRTRTLAASLLMERPGTSGAGVRVELIPTAPGDPLLPVGTSQTDCIVVSAAAAARLRVSAGDVLNGRLARIIDGRREVVDLALTVQAVAPPASFARDAAFVSLPLAVLVEDFQDGRTGAPTTIATLPGAERAEYAGFRLYARQLEQVPALTSALQADGIEVVSRASDVVGLLRIDRNLGILFELVAGLGGFGVLMSLGAGLWANVERKRISLAQLRFLGLHAPVLRLFPMVQAGILAALGVLVAFLAAFPAAAVVNHVFAGTLALDRSLCLITPAAMITTAGVTVAASVLVAAAAATRAARVEPWEGINTP